MYSLETGALPNAQVQQRLADALLKSEGLQDSVCGSVRPGSSPAVLPALQLLLCTARTSPALAQALAAGTLPSVSFPENCCPVRHMPLAP